MVNSKSTLNLIHQTQVTAYWNQLNFWIFLCCLLENYWFALLEFYCNRDSTQNCGWFCSLKFHLILTSIDSKAKSWYQDQPKTSSYYLLILSLLNYLPFFQYCHATLNHNKFKKQSELTESTATDLTTNFIKFWAILHQLKVI